MEHKQKTLQPVSEEFKDHVTAQPSPTLGSLADLEERIGSPHVDTSLSSVQEARQQVDGFAEPQLTPQQNIGAQHVDLTDQPVQAQPEEVAPVSDVRPAPLVSSDTTTESTNENGPPAVPPPLMPPNSQPQFFDADGKNNNPFSAK